VLGGSSYLAEVHGITAGRPPALDLDAELAVQEAALKLIGDGLVSAAHDCSDGGLAVAVAEMAIASECGVIVNPDTIVSGRLDEGWFGEAPSRILLAVHESNVERTLKTLLPTPATLTEMGGFGGDAIRLGADADVPLAAVRTAFDGALRS
jgi:phosphoribosylformylglycinamidine synthase